MRLRTQLKQMFADGVLAGKTFRQICSALAVTKPFERRALQDEITALEKENFLFSEKGKYVLFENAGLIRGRIRAHAKGYAFLIPEDESLKDLFIPAHALNGAFHGDVVYVRSFPSDYGDNDEAEVVRIAERNTELVGTYRAEKAYGFVVPDEEGYAADIFVRARHAKGAATGDKVVVELTDFPFEKNPEGRVVRILGKKYDLGAEERSIVASHKIPTDFPEEVAEYVRGRDFSVAGAADGEDFTNETVVTVDGEDARDLDDAISLKTADNGHFLLGVHIADVAYYVPEGSAPDREAYARGTSVYFPDNVIPMLPRELSNGVCSLREGENRRTLSCLMEIDRNGDVCDGKITRGVIRSRRRLTYDAVDEILSGEKRFEDEDVLSLLGKMKELTEILIEKRRKRGSVDLDVKEAEIRVNERGEISITPLNRTLSRRMIEEFMILANETVAEFVRYAEIPFLYRVHERPSPEKTAEFTEYLKRLGISARWSANGVRPSDFARLLGKVEASPLFPLVNKRMLRSMSKARYSPENTGHFGLASDCYCHFTSPIRRYPDLIVHRAICAMLDGKIAEWSEEYAPKIGEIAARTSECERRADEAERDVDDLFKARAMKAHIGEEFDGLVSGVTSFGVFVELANTVEGLIKLETLPAGRYAFDKVSYTLSSGKLAFRLGDRVKIRVAGVDSANRKVEFLFINKV